MKKCKHKHHEIRNEEIGGFNIPESCTTEYDIYCADCGEKLGHWAYGVSNIEYRLKYELNWWQRIIEKLKVAIIDIKYRIKNIREHDNNGDLPF